MLNSRWIVAGTLALAVTSPAMADDVADGEVFVKQRCLSCHNREKLMQYATRAPEAERPAKWQKFLPTHFVPNEKERSKVIAWLVEATRKP